MLVAAHHRAEDHARRRGTAASAGCPGGRGRCPSACRASWWCRWMSLMPLVLCVPARRLASCQLTDARQDVACAPAGRTPRRRARSRRPPCCRGCVTVSFMTRLFLLLRRGARRPARRRRSAAGNGSSFGALRLTASRDQHVAAFAARHRARDHDQAALGVGRRRPSRFCVVTRSSPRWPAIFLPLKVRPGSWRLPVEPWLRCETDTPWVARRPPKF